MHTTASHPEWMAGFSANHRSLMQYVDGLAEEDLCYSAPGKWNAGRQLEHVYLCLKIMSSALASKAFIEQTFGRIDRPARSHSEINAWYRLGLAAGGKAPERYEPGPFTPERKAGLLSDLNNLLQTMEDQAAGYSDEELDSLVLPHPFLGKLTIREMFFLMTEHPLIHKESIARGLRDRAVVLP